MDMTSNVLDNVVYMTPHCVYSTQVTIPVRGQSNHTREQARSKLRVSRASLAGAPLVPPRIYQAGDRRCQRFPRGIPPPTAPPMILWH